MQPSSGPVMSAEFYGGIVPIWFNPVSPPQAAGSDVMPPLDLGPSTFHTQPQPSPLGRPEGFEEVEDALLDAASPPPPSFQQSGIVPPPPRPMRGHTQHFDPNRGEWVFTPTAETTDLRERTAAAVARVRENERRERAKRDVSSTLTPSAFLRGGVVTTNAQGRRVWIPTAGLTPPSTRLGGRILVREESHGIKKVTK